jgi:hypothetical protein
MFRRARKPWKNLSVIMEWLDEQMWITPVFNRQEDGFGVQMDGLAETVSRNKFMEVLHKYGDTSPVMRGYRIRALNAEATPDYRPSNQRLHYALSLSGPGAHVHQFLPTKNTTHHSGQLILELPKFDEEAATIVWDIVTGKTTPALQAEST